MALAALTSSATYTKFYSFRRNHLSLGAYLGSKQRSIFLVLLVMFLTDFILNNTIARSFFLQNKRIDIFSDYMVFNALSIIAMVWIRSLC